jgi:uncharacterized RDD family membrane protein YckC
VLASGEHACNFCESTETPIANDTQVSARSQLPVQVRSHEEWRGELDQRLQAYRAKRRRSFENEAQTALPFDDQSTTYTPVRHVAVEVDEAPAAAEIELPTSSEQDHNDDFAFTIAIGRVSNTSQLSDPRLLIDVSSPPQEDSTDSEVNSDPLPAIDNGFYASASLEDRKKALLIDAACLAFAYGAFLALFGSLGGHFTLSKLSATVCFFTFAFVYVQYFGLFTVFGGSTPGMMASGIQVASFTGDSPSPRQYLLRALGYLLSAGTCFLGFLWVLWDEDGLTWHDRMSNTYLARVEPFGDESRTAQPTATQ